MLTRGTCSQTIGLGRGATDFRKPFGQGGSKAVVPGWGEELQIVGNLLGEGEVMLQLQNGKWNCKSQEAC